MNNTLRRRRRREQNKVKFILGLVLAAVVLLYIINVSLGTGTIKGDVDVSGKGYVTVTVHNEETLWSIANDYMNTDYYTVETFIDEVVDINDIRNNQIYAGEQIMIPIIADNSI